MSKMQELYEKVSKDSMLQDKFASIMQEANAAGKEMVEEQLTAFAKEAGYDVTVEEMQSFFRKLSESNHNELSTEELDLVAGGKTNFGVLILSVASFGAGCAVVSVAAAIKNITCEEFLDEACDTKI